METEGAGPRDWFVAGPENQLVGTAIRWVLDPQWDPSGPIFVYGPPGTGKTRLGRGVVASWKAGCGDRQAIFIPAVDFARQLADAVAMQAGDDFSARYRSLSLLVVDDVHWLSGKAAAQQELLCTLDVLLRSGGRVLLTSRLAPSDLSGFSPALLGRWTGGLVVPLCRPGPEARRRLIDRYLRARSLELPPGAADLLAERLAVTAPELVGFLQRLTLEAEVRGKQIDQEVVRQLLTDRQPFQGVDLPTVARATARCFHVPIRELRGASRRRAVLDARGMAVYLARTVANKTLEEIGRYFGGRDRTTVAHACRRTSNLLATEPSARQTLVQLKETLRSGRSRAPHSYGKGNP